MVAVPKEPGASALGVRRAPPWSKPPRGRRDDVLWLRLGFEGFDGGVHPLEFQLLHLK